AAIKCIDKSAIRDTVGAAEQALREILVLLRLRHRRITQLLEVVDADDDFLYLVLEYEAGGELFDELRRVDGAFPEHRARELFRQLLAAVRCCHAAGVVHRDLKPENLLLDANGDLKLIDFGFANLVRGDTHMETFAGSPAYAAP
ncbi:Serine/threonine-protein kinase pim-3, partial [Cladochytrium tenue]